MKPTVSINMCVLNGENYIREALESIVAQTYNDWELIIINDGSSDSTESIILEFKNKGYPIIYQYQENKGLGASRNEALKLSHGEYIAFIDHDDIWFPEKLEKQVPLFKKKPEVGLVFSDTIFFNYRGDQLQLYKKYKPPRGNVFKELLTNYFLSLETVVIRKKSLDAMDQWFDDRFNLTEEGDFFRRLAYDWELDYVDEPLAKYRRHNESLSFKRQDLWPKETEIMVEKFCNLFDSFEEVYKHELHILRSRINYHYAMHNWEQGNGWEARKLLKEYLKIDKKYLFVYLISLLPYVIFKKLIEHRRRF
ncbi:MAG TPA: glycosyltransferase [Candidatus Scalindua sp.]|nr:glycosyltransferase [Candidatus Scalindua sp.]